MAQLKDYDLISGDWVKIKHPFSNSYIWTEFKSFDNRYYFQQLVHTLHCTHEVEAVLRPSVIVRDELDNILSTERNMSPFSAMPQLLEFKKIHPKQEREGLLERVFEAQQKYNEPKVMNALMIICDEIDKLREKMK